MRAFHAEVESTKDDFDMESEYESTISFLNSFYEVLEDDVAFKKDILDRLRTR